MGSGDDYMKKRNQYIGYYRKKCLLCPKILVNRKEDFEPICEWDKQFVKQAKGDIELAGKLKEELESKNFTEWK